MLASMCVGTMYRLLCVTVNNLDETGLVTQPVTFGLRTKAGALSQHIALLSQWNAAPVCKASVTGQLG